jgi:hypothetical protein
MKITVAEGIQVVHEGHRYADGDTAEVPDYLAEKWVRSGWASEITEPEPKAPAEPEPRTGAAPGRRRGV